MSNPVRAIPEGYHTVTPYLTCKNSAKAIDFYKSVFGATEITRMTGPDGKVGHAELKVGDSHIFLADEFPGMNIAPTPGVKNACGIFLYLEKVDGFLIAPWPPAPPWTCRSPISFGATAMAKSPIRLATSGAWRSTWKTLLPKK